MDVMQLVSVSVWWGGLAYGMVYLCLCVQSSFLSCAELFVFMLDGGSVCSMVCVFVCLYFCVYV